ncbi:MAG: SDR family oxidoreductase [Peptostreptococcaceae bacterium]|nr:SDR family oxidoreductase [Peptostreptococcaceae bacterium]
MKGAEIMLTLNGRTAMITGGASGIGFAIATDFLKNGMRVALVDICQDAVMKAEKDLKEISLDVAGFECDISDNDSISSVIARIVERFKGIDVIVNCAGILSSESIQNTKRETWDKILSVNLSGTFFVTQQAIPHLEKSLNPRIINISSVAGRMGGFQTSLAYTSSKGGIISLTYGLARQLAPQKITVNAICPGTVETKLLQAFSEEALSKLRAQVPLRRIGKVEDVSAAACYFASEEAEFVTGAVLDINGGMFMG